MLLEDIGHSVRLFLVLGYGDDRLDIVLNRHIIAHSRIYRGSYGTEDCFDLGFNLVNIDVADDHDALLVGTVPFLIIVADSLIREIVYDFHGADGQAVCIFVVGIDLGKDLFVHTHLGVLAAAPLFVDDAALLVDVLTLEKQAVSPVMEDPQAGVDGARNGNRHVVDVINCFVYGRVCIQVSSELHTDRFQILDQSVAGEMLGAIEAHVLKEVGQTALVFVFEDRSHFLGDIEMSLVFRLFVVTDVIGQTVIQFSDAYLLVYRNLGHLLLGGCSRGHAQ